MNEAMETLIASLTLGELFSRCPAARDYLVGLRLETLDETQPFAQAVINIPERCFEEFETSRLDVAETLAELLFVNTRMAEEETVSVDTLTILGGYDKAGEREKYSLTVRCGETVAVVGPTGSGKSCLLADIECLAQGETPSGRRILLNGEPPIDAARFDIEYRPVAQLSQNMNFILDLTVEDFLFEHMQSRQAPDHVITEIFACANELAGEPFSLDTHITRLSGGQARALMIADTLLLSNSPIILIDEIENAGIDRIQAVRLFRQTGKLIFLSTHDPLLALSVTRRIVIQNGAIVQIIESGEEEDAVNVLTELDAQTQTLRNEIRTGKKICGHLSDWFAKKNLVD